MSMPQMSSYSTNILLHTLIGMVFCDKKSCFSIKCVNCRVVANLWCWDIMPHLWLTFVSASSISMRYYLYIVMWSVRQSLNRVVLLKNDYKISWWSNPIRSMLLINTVFISITILVPNTSYIHNYIQRERKKQDAIFIMQNNKNIFERNVNVDY